MGSRIQRNSFKVFRRIYEHSSGIRRGILREAVVLSREQLAKNTALESADRVLSAFGINISYPLPWEKKTLVVIPIMPGAELCGAVLSEQVVSPSFILKLLNDLSSFACKYQNSRLVNVSIPLIPYFSITLSLCTYKDLKICPRQRHGRNFNL